MIRWLGRARPDKPGHPPLHPILDDEEFLSSAKWSFSTHGEDLVLREILARANFGQRTGFYVDVGAYHPWQFSNTADLYSNGWRGILVEPNPEMAALLKQERPRDITVETAIAASEGAADFFYFGGWASSNTLDRTWADSVATSQGVPVKDVITVRTTTLARLLDQFLPDGVGIDFLSVDVEGLDLVSLESNDWDRFRPLVVAVEEFEMDLAHPETSEVFVLMRGQGYRLVSRTVLTNFYLRS